MSNVIDSKEYWAVKAGILRYYPDWVGAYEKAVAKSKEGNSNV
jgi:hypothetical protein